MTRSASRSSADADADADGRRYAFLGTGGVPMVTLWQQSAAPFPADRAGLHHLAFQVADVAALTQIEARLRTLGAAIRDDSGVSGEPAAVGQFFCYDPDGIRLEFHAVERPSRPVPAAGDGPACGFF